MNYLEQFWRYAKTKFLILTICSYGNENNIKTKNTLEAKGTTRPLC